MKRFLSRSLLLFLFVVVWSGCEEAVLVEVTRHQRQIVAKALICPDSLWHVNVSTSVGYLEPTDILPLRNATVEILEDDEPLETLYQTVLGSFYGRQTRPRAGANYTLIVTAPNYQRVEASTTLSLSAVVPRMTSERSLDEDGDPSIIMNVVIDDPFDEHNYYAIDVLHRMDVGRGQDSQSYLYLTGFESNDVVLRGVDFGNESSFFETAYFEDDVFNGQTRTIRLKTYDQSYPNYNDDLTFTLFLRVFVTDEDFYRYHKTVEMQDELDDDPFSEPVRIYSNTSNGFGIFAGYRVYEHVLAQW